MNINKTAIGVVAFIIISVAALYSAKANADNSQNGARVSLGKSVINSHLKVGEVGYEYNDWEVAATLVKAGNTRNGHQEQMEIYSVSYLTKPDWGYKGFDPYLRLGVSYNSGSRLVGKRNFRLGVGMDFHNVWRLEFNHYSSAGIEPVNTGVDAVTITYKIPPLF